MPPSRLDTVPYRACVGIALFNRQGLVWTGRRLTDSEEYRMSHWQMPQGGIDEGEDPRAAAFRELHEETGARSAQVVHEIEDWLKYDFPVEIIEAKRFRNRGQRQKWFAMLFTGEDSEFDLEVHKPEFDEWRWADITTLPELIVPFKRRVYEQVVEAFAPVGQRIAAGELG